MGRPSARLVSAALVVSLIALPATNAGARSEERIAKLIASTDGASQETAYKVRSVSEEYAVLKALHLEARSQSLMTPKRGKAYDVIEAVDPATGETRSIWFDISAFFGRGFGL
ncbi:DUF4919 domain-containing protein [Sphingobium lignivorans]|uniref:Uncharacterized protein n=1 Tax=Sphingobium lignivorans TaxID=2735886 RepID=A0ABR6NFG1_9SPHN|nr:hypothetical protein [Sphingobium lignivorans]MBB5986029.1 hypothetical protein [Sphingobium lignivorans]